MYYFVRQKPLLREGMPLRSLLAKVVCEGLDLAEFAGAVGGLFQTRLGVGPVGGHVLLDYIQRKAYEFVRIVQT